MSIKLVCEKCGAEEEFKNLLNEREAPKILIDRFDYPFYIRGKCLVCGNEVSVVTKERD